MIVPVTMWKVIVSRLNNESVEYKYMPAGWLPDSRLVSDHHHFSLIMLAGSPVPGNENLLAYGV